LDTQDEDKQEWTIQRNMQHSVHKTKKNKNGQSREAFNIGYTRRRKTRMNILCTQCYKFLWIVYSCLSSSCVPNVTSFSELSILVFLGLVYPMLQVSEKLITMGTQDEEKQEWTMQRNL
jgi:hypothetical protein